VTRDQPRGKIASRTAEDRHKVLREEEAWDRIAREFLADSPQLVSVSRFIGDSRVYRRGNVRGKIRSAKTPLPPGVNSLKDEAAISRRVGVAATYRQKDGWEALLMPWIEGAPLEHGAVRQMRLRKRIRLISTILSELRRLHARGVAHGDLHVDNVLVRPEGVAILDFDRAVTGSGARLWWEEMRSRSPGGTPRHPLWRLILLLLTPRLKGAQARLQALRPMRGRTVKQSPGRSGHLEHTEDTDLALLRAAWALAEESDANAPGQGVAYYAFTYTGVHLSGERPWYLRWDQIRRGVEFDRKRLLELGCNMGLLSCFALLHGATSSLGVDRDRGMVGSARLVARALRVPAEFQAVDLASPEPWEDRLGGADIVTVLSLFHWLPPDAQARLMTFLGRYREVLWEGHDHPDVEISRLRRAGFSTVITLAQSERHRAIFHGVR
jgi:hypothetical protein